MSNLDQVNGNYGELVISEPPPPYTPGTSHSYNTISNGGTQFHVSEVPSGSQSAVVVEQKGM